MTDLPDLDRLIAAVTAESLTDEPLDRLVAAARTRDELDDLTEALLDHFVEEARQAGCSWSQIGSALGVSKQAAQQRHTTTESVARRLLSWIPQQRRGSRGTLFRRFTDRARASVVHAQDAARRLGHHYIGTEHILLGIYAEPQSVAAKALLLMGVTAEAVEETVVEIIGRGQEPPPRGHIPFTPRAKKVLELSLREAIALGHNYIGTEHMLLGLAREEKGVAAQILAGRGVDYDRVRQVITSMLGMVT